MKGRTSLWTNWSMREPNSLMIGRWRFVTWVMLLAKAQWEEEEEEENVTHRFHIADR